MKLELLPRKEFEIHLDSGEIIKGKYSTWSIKRFCDKKSLSLADLDKKMNAENLTIDDLIEIILCAVEHKQRESGLPFIYKDFDVCNWIEEMGGLQSDDFMRLQSHAYSDLGEKKSQEII